MNKLPPLKIGTAYHGNRMLHHARQDLEDMISYGMNLVVHMLSHTDLNRHKNKMKEMFALSEEMGMEVWVDCWGLAGPPGDVSHFLAYHPESHMVYSNGSLATVYACLKDPALLEFIKNWIDEVASCGGKTVFWDEPHMPSAMVDGKKVYSCCCPRCRKAFEEKYGHPMPEYATEETEEFGIDSIIEYLREITDYAASKGLKNATCIMPQTMSPKELEGLFKLPHLDNIGTDPYWRPVPGAAPNPDVYKYVYEKTRVIVELCEKYGKDLNLWIKAYNIAAGTEDDIVLATLAAYNAGARTIISWSYYGAESNDYASEKPLASWSRTRDAARLIRDKETLRIAAECEKTMPSVYDK